MEYEDLIGRLRECRAVILDADGVWFDGKETRDAEGRVSKTRDYRDGQGLSFLRALGIPVMFATGEGEPLNSIVAKLNELPSCKSGKWALVGIATQQKGGKVAACEAWLREQLLPVPEDPASGVSNDTQWSQSLSWRDAVYIGDDRTDLEAMRACKAGGGIVVVPSDAQRCARKLADIVLTKPGGGGAVREFAEMVCDARGVDEEGLATA